MLDQEQNSITSVECNNNSSDFEENNKTDHANNLPCTRPRLLDLEFCIERKTYVRTHWLVTGSLTHGYGC
jgi:hypothetical protein